MIGFNGLGITFAIVSTVTVVLSAVCSWLIRKGCYTTLPDIDVTKVFNPSHGEFSPDYPTADKAMVWLVFAFVTYVGIYAIAISGYIIHVTRKCLIPLINIFMSIALLVIEILVTINVTDDCKKQPYTHASDWLLDQIPGQRNTVLGLMITVPCLTLIAMIITLWLQYSTQASDKKSGQFQLFEHFLL